MTREMIDALKQIEREKNIPLELLIETLEEALLSAYKRNYGMVHEARVTVDQETGEMAVFAINEAGKEEEVTPSDFGRIAAQTAKQAILQRIREVERDMMYDDFKDREGDIVTGIVQQSDQRYTLIDLGKVEALLPPQEQAPGERYEHGSRLKTYVIEVRKSTKGPQIIVSRTHPGLLKRLFELEVPEIGEGFVEIKSVAREAGYRSKIAVVSNDENVDPVGACVGSKGSRVRMVVSELRGEKIDIVKWSDDESLFIANALSPAKVSRVLVNDATKTALVIAPDDQLSLAIGKEGQNVRLAAKLTGTRIDIKSEDTVTEEEIAAFSAAGGNAAPAESEAPKNGMCQAVTAKGTPCKRKACADSDFCATHGKK
jgi:N utilization substance protein A